MPPFLKIILLGDGEITQEKDVSSPFSW